MQNLPFWVTPLFLLATVAAFAVLYYAVRRAAPRHAPYFGAGVLGWLAVQALLGASGFYFETTALPPRFIAAIGPPLLVILALFLTPRGRAFLDRLPADALTYLHTVRLPIELVLFALFTARLVPQLLTFEGRNFDIIAGLTAPLVAWFGYTRPRLPRAVLIAWNVLAMALVLNVVIHGILSAPSPFQQFAFDQPNVGVFYFPFVWLPSFLVPAVLLAMAVCLRQLTVRPSVAAAPVAGTA